VESAWYDWWEKEGFFKPQLTTDGKVKPAGVFEMAHPPPNVTGMLHIGHALNLSLEDILCRWSRMHGKTTLFLPGSDHAGIATQVVVEKMLMRQQNKSRHDLGREKFIELVWQWKDDYHARISKATRRTGVSMDWSREAFTMDQNLSAAVAKTFVQLHEEGLIYRAKRLVNWCPTLNTAISNLEVENKELTGRTLLDVPGYARKVEFGVLTYFKYPLEGSEATIEVATTRPETMIGDTGIAVNPNDERYKHLVGRKARHPFLSRLLPIFADEYVDAEFGTGAVKITPAHDHNDFDLGDKHGLPMINIMNDDGTLNENAGSFKGMKRFEARYEVIKQLKEKGLWVKQADNAMTVPICERSKDVVEPIIKPQWFMSMREMADEAAKAVRDGRIKMQPDVHARNFLRWMDGMQDWCLSRQLWWGHQIPAYFVAIEGEDATSGDGTKWVSAASEEAAQAKAKSLFPGKHFTLHRDEDVLDTWFSSQLWPFSTLGWPNKTEDLERFFPTSVMETGHDINRIWVARMIMISLKMTGKIPFHEVYCHPMVRDSEGRKMSKSLGNTIDPIDIMDGIELQLLHDKLRTGNLDPRELTTAEKYQKTAFPNGIPECGADALRFALASYTTGGLISPHLYDSPTNGNR
jgi:valyl-tRNA synthetase